MKCLWKARQVILTLELFRLCAIFYLFFILFIATLPTHYLWGLAFDSHVENMTALFHYEVKLEPLKLIRHRHFYWRAFISAGHICVRVSIFQLDYGTILTGVFSFVFHLIKLPIHKIKLTRNMSYIYILSMQERRWPVSLFKCYTMSSKDIKGKQCSTLNPHLIANTICRHLQESDRIHFYNVLISSQKTFFK